MSEKGKRERKKSGDFAIVPTRAALDPKLSRGALRLLILIASHAGQLRYAWPGQRLLAERLAGERGKCDRHNVQRYIKELVDRGYLRVMTKHGRSSVYQVIHDPGVDVKSTSSWQEEVDVETPPKWTSNPSQVDVTLTSETERTEEEQIASLAPLSAASSPITPETDGDQQWEKNVPMSSRFPPGVTNAKEWIEYIRNQKAAARKDAEAEGLIAETLDAEVVETEEVG